MIKDVSKWRELLLWDFLENDSDNQKEFIQYIFKRYEDFKIKLYLIFEDPKKKDGQT